PLITALGNDLGFESVFREQLQTYASRGDILIAISGSGNSPNLLEAVRLATDLGLRTVAMTGFDGGALRPMADLSLHSPVDEMQVAQDGHMVMVHLIVTGFRSLVRARLEHGD
ncbi:MAG: SIS domain-containing protein, partial [Planctomycetota bacterium]